MVNLIGVIGTLGTIVTFVMLIIAIIRKKPKKKTLIALAAFFVLLVIALILAPDPIPTAENDTTSPPVSADISEPVVDAPENTVTEQEDESEMPIDNQTVTPEQNTTEEPVASAENDSPTAAEQFAEDNDVSTQFAESLETVLAGIELTDKSRVGVFHYDLSDVYDWKQIDDWANGHRYSAWMAQEHIFYFYENDDTVVGVRDGKGNIFYSDSE